jgi:hypothetical protein
VAVKVIHPRLCQDGEFIRRFRHEAEAAAKAPADARGLIEACLAKDPRQRPDLGRVAAHSTATAERRGYRPPCSGRTR